MKGKSRPNIEGQIELQKKVENYVPMLQDRVEAGEIKATTCMQYWFRLGGSAK